VAGEGREVILDPRETDFPEDLAPAKGRAVFKIATFNVNSIRSRLDAVLAWMARHRPDALCLQETKCQDVDFPLSAFEKAGIRVVFKGEKAYNGVAVASPHEISDVSFGYDDGGTKDQARLIRATVAGVRIVNTYVPQGQSLESPVFRYKIEWFGRLRDLFEKGYSPDEKLIWCGDLNVAPEPADVYDPKHLDGSVCFHPEERAALKDTMDWGLVDVFRKHNREAGQFTFWDYRIPGSVKRNLGWRLDHMMATCTMAARSTASYIDMELRLADRPSDHTILVAEFDL
jgi:exodeoxyribonuclease-3